MANGDRVDAPRDALRGDDLEGVAGDDVAPGRADHRRVVGLAISGTKGASHGAGGAAPARSGGQRPMSRRDLIGIPVVAGLRDDLHRLPDVVERDHDRREEEACGDAASSPSRGGGSGTRRLETRDRVVGRRSRRRRRRTAAARVVDAGVTGERLPVRLRRGRPRRRADLEALQPGAEERVAADLLAALDRLEQESQGRADARAGTRPPA